jgi:hypothetical protein
VTSPAACAWCTGRFEQAIRGDQRKLFCSTPCRMAFHKAARQWAEREFFDGRVSARELHAVSSPCTAKRLDSDSWALSGCPPTQDSPAGFLANPRGISVLWATPEGQNGELP